HSSGGQGCPVWRLQVALPGAVDAGEADHGLYFAEPFDLDDLSEQVGETLWDRGGFGEEVVVLAGCRGVAEEVPLGVQEPGGWLVLGCRGPTGSLHRDGGAQVGWGQFPQGVHGGHHGHYRGQHLWGWLGGQDVPVFGNDTGD